MPENIIVVHAHDEDVTVIYSILRSNFEDSSLYQQPTREIKKNINDFFIAKLRGNAAGCAALHQYSPDIAEILAVSVIPTQRNQGIGKALIERCIQHAKSKHVSLLWLSTAKPDYFSRYGFSKISKSSLPTGIFLHKVRLTFQQPIIRWIPAFFGRYTFMKYEHQ